jgi:exodeoxyribonuclease V alpha subunit
MAERLAGELLRFTYNTDDGGFAVAGIRVRLPDGGEEEHTAVGPIGHLSPGVHLVLEGDWKSHPRFGRNFRVKSYLVEDPQTLTGLERYLASGAVQGLGPELARRAVEKFGLDTLRVLSEEPERLREVNGIGEKRLKEIRDHWERDRTGRQLAVLLRAHGLGAAVTNRILDRYGEQALQVISQDPYRLAAEISGIGFRTADAIAASQGIGPMDPRRSEAGVRWLLNRAEDEGHTYLPREELLERVKELKIAPMSARGAIDRLVLKRFVVGRPLEDGGEALLGAARDRMEADVAMALARRCGGEPAPLEAVHAAAGRVGIELNEDQTDAVAVGLGHLLSVITGGPGTGKTTIVKVLLAAAALRKERWLLAAPTGRAARRLAESCGAEGKTVHRLLEYSPRERRFTRDAAKPLEAEGVLVDEASMIDLPLFDALLASLPPGCRLVLVGDADQLPSVGCGRVLGDLIDSGVVPVARLSQVYRQAAGSAIVQSAHRILRGGVPVSAERDPGLTSKDFYLVPRTDAEDARDTLLTVVAERLPRQGFDPRGDVQVLTPMHRGPLGSRALNAALQRRLNPSGRSLKRGERLLREGDRVIQVRNDYDNDVFNGDVGRITAVEGGSLVVDFDGREVTLVGEQLDQVELAYAISIHKSQGSEYPAVVVALHTSHFVMLRRNLLYTAITRAKRFCCVVGAPRALEIAAGKGGGDERWTLLARRLRDAAG